MLTNNYLNLVRGSFSTSTSGSNIISKITANFTTTAGTAATAAYSTATSDTTKISTYAMDLLKVLFFSGLLYKYNYPTYSGYLGCVFIGLDTKTEILPTDYTMSNSFNDYMTLTRSGEYILITVNNTSGSSLTFNTVQVGCTFHTAINTSTADSNYVLLAEYMLPSQTIVAGGSATYRLKIDNA